MIDLSYIKQEDSGGGGDISGSGATNQVAFFNGTKTITSDSDFTVNSSNGRLAVTGGVNIPTGSAAAPALAITGDTDTGVFSAGANQIGFTVAGSDALGVGANKNVTVGGASGTAGQVLTSGGSGGATTWTTVSGGGSSEKTKNIGYITSPIDDKTGGTDVSVYSICLNTTGTGTGTPTSGVATDSMTLIPFIVPIVPTTSSMQFSFRTVSTAGSEWGVGWYASDSDGIPNGSPFYSNVFTPTAFTTYTLNSGQLLSKGDLIWFAYFGQTTATSLNIASNVGGPYNFVPELRSSLSYLAKAHTALTTTTSAATTFDSLSQSTVFDTKSVTDLIRIAMTF